MKKKKRVLTRIALVSGGIVLSSFLSFYVVVLSGAVPSMQELWVTTAMTTLSHKWLATAFIPASTIDEIMTRTKVDDSQYITDTSLVNQEVMQPIEEPKEQDEVVEEEKDAYIEEGYNLLEDGVYTKEVKGGTWKGHLMLITDSSRIMLVDSAYQFEKGQTVKKMVEQTGGVAGINAGGFVDGPNYDSNGGIPAGLLMKRGEVINPAKDNGKKHSVIGFTKDHVLVMGKMTIEEAKAKGVWDCVVFSPYLIVNGETVIKEGNGGWGIAPRTAIGQRATGEVIFLVIDGRQPGHSIGVDLRVLQDTLYKEKCINAGMMDGGSSTVMVYQGEFVNKPSLGHERYINNAWVVK